MLKPSQGKADSEGSDCSESIVFAHYFVASLFHVKDVHKCEEKSNISGPLSSGTGSLLNRRAIPGPLPCARPILEFPPSVHNSVHASGFLVPAYQFAWIRLEGLFGWPFPNS